MNSVNLDRERLEREANFARAQLADTLDALDHKRHDVLDVKARVRPHIPQLIAAGVVSVLALAGGVVLSVVRARRRARHQGRERIAAMARAWKHPDRLATYKDRPLGMELVRRLVMTAATVGLSLLAKQARTRLELPMGSRRTHA